MMVVLLYFGVLTFYYSEYKESVNFQKRNLMDSTAAQPRPNKNLKPFPLPLRLRLGTFLHI